MRMTLPRLRALRILRDNSSVRESNVTSESPEPMIYWQIRAAFEKEGLIEPTPDWRWRLTDEGRRIAGQLAKPSSAVSSRLSAE